MTFIFNGETDNKGNSYHKCYSNIETNSVICIDGRNIVIRGNPKVSIRKGNKSKYGGELLFEFLIKEKIKEYPANSNHETIEYYLPLEQGILFLEQSLEYLKDKLEKTKNGDENNG